MAYFCSERTRTSVSGKNDHPYRYLSRRAMLAGLLSIAIGGNLVAKNESGSVTITDFVPGQHGFHFSNRFKNVVLDMPGVHLVTWGRCGGMAYGALDYYFAQRPVPQYTQVPECEEPGAPVPLSYPAKAYDLSHYLFWRQIDSMKAIWPFGRAGDFLFYTLASDEDLLQKAIGSEAQKLINCLRTGRPVPLGLIGVRDVTRIGENHQVVCHGYAVDPATSLLSTLSIYDPNHPDQNVTLSINKSGQCLDESTGKKWRGFFVRDDYVPQSPPL